MKAFHNKASIKAKYVNRVKAHALADEIIKGRYWANGKGCAVGCTIHSGQHNAYETELGIPEWLARVEDTIFDGLPLERAKLWPEQFLKAIKPGASLEKIKVPFIVLVLESALKSMEASVFDKKANPQIVDVQKQVRKAIKQVIKAHKTGKGLSAAESAAWSAAESAAGAAWSAAGAARSAAESAAGAARSAAESAAGAARSAAWSAAGAARSAAWSAAWSAAGAAESAARSAKYEYFADELLKLLRGCK